MGLRHISTSENLGWGLGALGNTPDTQGLEGILTCHLYFERSKMFSPSCGWAKGEREIEKEAGESEKSTDSASAGHLFTQKCQSSAHSSPQLR